MVLATGSRPRDWPAWADGGPAYRGRRRRRRSRRPAPPDPGAVALVVDDEGGFVAPTAAEALVAAGWAVTDRHQPHLGRRRGRPDPGLVRPSATQARRRRAARLGDARPDARRRRWTLVDLESDQARSAGPVDLVVAGQPPPLGLDELSGRSAHPPAAASTVTKIGGRARAPDPAGRRRRGRARWRDPGGSAALDSRPRRRVSAPTRTDRTRPATAGQAVEGGRAPSSIRSPGACRPPRPQ